jgi:hypothetical protein
LSSVPRTRSFDFSNKSFINETGRSQGYVEKGLQKCLYIKLFWYLLPPLSHTPPTFSAVKTPENTEEDPADPEPADKGDIQMQYSSD